MTAEPDSKTINGIVERIIFRNDDTGYTVCALKTSERAQPLVVVGNCAAVWEGENLRAEGAWRQHKVHGAQFHAAHMLCVEPTSRDGIQRYLGSGMIDGIGPVLAERLVAKFGDQTLAIIEKESARLESVEGIGRKRREQIKSAWNAQKAVREIMIFLHTHGIGAAQAARIHRTYGDQAIARIRENPYRLATDIWGIGFKTADRIGGSLGIPRDSIHRAGAGILHTLQVMADDGHCFAEDTLLLDEAGQLLEISGPILPQALDAALEARVLIREDHRIFLPHLHLAETGVAQHLRRLQQTPSPALSLDIEKALPWAAGRMRLEFAAGQQQALRAALTEKILIITGGPGVGKTTIIRALTDIWHVKKMRLCLAAPTGRAAKRMEEATGRKAQTIHRLLKFTPGAGGFEHNQHNPLTGDIFILDEISMIDIVLAHAFLRAIPPNARLILVGDPDQLPSVGPGNLLRDLLASGSIPRVKLETVFRQGARSWIVHNAHLINAGRTLELPPGDELADFYFVQEDDPERLTALAVEIATRRIPARFHLNPLTDVQVLSPMRRFQLGADTLNLALQQAVNPEGPALQHNSWTYRQGDRVMQLRNNYDKNVFNGDIGFIAAVDNENRSLQVHFDEQQVIYKSSEFDELSLAYACSIHKSQGSEYPAAVILIAKQHHHLLQRNLLYTAITRGRRLVCLLGSHKAVQTAIRNNRILLRRTSLGQRLSIEGNKAACGHNPPPPDGFDGHGPKAGRRRKSQVKVEG